jgi:hypothetical protein
MEKIRDEFNQMKMRLRVQDQTETDLRRQLANSLKLNENLENELRKREREQRNERESREEIKRLRKDLRQKIEENLGLQNHLTLLKNNQMPIGKPSQNALRDEEKRKENLRRESEAKESEKDLKKALKDMERNEKMLKIEVEQLKYEKVKLEDELIMIKKEKKLEREFEKELARVKEMRKDDEKKLREAQALMDSLREDFKEYKRSSEAENWSLEARCRELEEKLNAESSRNSETRNREEKAERRKGPNGLEIDNDKYKGIIYGKNWEKETRKERNEKRLAIEERKLDFQPFGTQGSRDDNRRRRELILAKRQELEKYNELLDTMIRNQRHEESPSSGQETD